MRWLPVPAFWRGCSVLVRALRPGWRAVVCRPASASAAGARAALVGLSRCRGFGVRTCRPCRPVAHRRVAVAESHCERVPVWTRASLLPGGVGDWRAGGCRWRSEGGIPPERSPFLTGPQGGQEVGSRGDAPCGGRGGKAPCLPDGRSERGRYSARVRPDRRCWCGTRWIGVRPAQGVASAGNESVGEAGASGGGVKTRRGRAARRSGMAMRVASRVSSGEEGGRA